MRGPLRRRLPQRAPLASIVVVNHKSNRHPDKEANPVHDGQAGHQKHTSENRQDGSKGAAGSSKGTMAVWFAVAENQNAGGDQRECEKRADVGKIGESSDVQKTRRYSHNKPCHPSGEIRRLVTRVDAAENSWKKTVARHGKPYASLTNLEHEQRGDHAHERANQHDQPNAGDVQSFESVDDGCGIVNQRFPADDSDEHHDHRDIKKRADDQRSDDAYGQIALWAVAFLRGSGHRVEADVGEEYDGATG